MPDDRIHRVMASLRELGLSSQVFPQVVVAPPTAVFTNTSSLKSTLPYDVLCNILGHTILGRDLCNSLVFLGRHLDKEIKLDLFKRRSDPKRAFDDLYVDTIALLNAMRKYRVILSGSRALNFFVPGVSNSRSDYNFYCGASAYDIQGFLAYMESVGFIFTDPVQITPRSHLYSSNISGVNGYINNRDGKVKVQIMWGKIFGSSLSCVARFRCTAEQCFITGFAAVCMYKELTTNMLSVNLWPSDQFIGQIVKGKYTERGFECMDSPGKIIIRTVPWYAWAKPNRHIGDKHSMVIPLEGYVETVNWEHPLSEYMNYMKSLEWCMTNGSITIQLSHTKVRFCGERHTLLKFAKLDPLVKCKGPALQQALTELGVKRYNFDCQQYI
ncbi:hypothetical protein QC760_010620 [Botrytis cinerea]